MAHITQPGPLVLTWINFNLYLSCYSYLQMKFHHELAYSSQMTVKKTQDLTWGLVMSAQNKIIDSRSKRYLII